METIETSVQTDRIELTTPGQLANKLFNIKHYEMTQQEEEVYMQYHGEIKELNDHILRSRLHKTVDESQFYSATETHQVIQYLLTDELVTRLATKYITDAGYDIAACCKEITINPGVTATIHTGVSSKLPSGFFFKVEGKSSLASKGVFPIGGIVDEGYTGEVRVLLFNSHPTDPFIVRNGDRIAQLVPQKTTAAYLTCEYLNKSGEKDTAREKLEGRRGANGFRSSGV